MDIPEKPKLLSRIRGSMSHVTAHRKAVIEFAKRHDLVYFNSVGSRDEVPVIRGSTATPKYIDNSYSIGTHAGYDMALVDRTNVVAYEGYASSKHRWYVIQIDLHASEHLPYIFIGTRQQTKAYYARVLVSHRETGYISPDMIAPGNVQFHSRYAVIASPWGMPVVHRLLSEDIVQSIAAHHHPFAIEIEGNSMSVITEATAPNQQLLNKLLHYGLWFAKELDKRLA